MEGNVKKSFFIPILLAIGIVTSPNYPDKYPNFLLKIETIQVEQGLIISLQFTAFDIDNACDTNELTCPCDYLTITDGDGTTLMENSCGSTSSDIYVGGQSIGSTLPANITSTSNIVMLKFVTDAATYSTYSGWSVSWSAVTPGEICLDIPGALPQFFVPHHK